MTAHELDDLSVDIGMISAEALEQHLERLGAATFHCEDLDYLCRWVTRLGTPYRHPHAGDDAVTTIETRSDHAPLGRRAFTSGGLYPHTDRSVLARPPGLLVFWCEESDAEGGDAVMVDGKTLFDDWAIPTGHVQVLMDPTNFIISADGTTARRPLLEQWGENEYSLRFRNDDGIHCSATALASFRQMLKAIESHVLTFPLHRGVGYIVQNTRWLHGRLPFHGYRKCSRLLLASFGEHHRTFSTFTSGARVAELPAA